MKTARVRRTDCAVNPRKYGHAATTASTVPLRRSQCVTIPSVEQQDCQPAILSC